MIQRIRGHRAASEGRRPPNVESFRPDGRVKVDPAGCPELAPESPRLPQAPGHRDAVPGFFGGATLPAGVLHPQRVAPDHPSQPHNHRHVCLGGFAVFDQVLLGAAGRPPAASGTHPHPRQAQELDADRAARNRRGPAGDGRPGSPRGTDARRAVFRIRRILLGHSGHRHRRLPDRSGGGRGSGRHGGHLPARLPHRPAGERCRSAVPFRILFLERRLFGHGGVHVGRPGDRLVHRRARRQRLGGLGHGSGAASGSTGSTRGSATQ